MSPEGNSGEITSVGCGGNSVEVLGWLKGLPLAPQYHPTLAEFQDPIGYIFKIEKEASRYGICKIVPPVGSAAKRTALSNLNRSLSARSDGGKPTFTSRQQQIGFCPRKQHHRPVQKAVWQSGETYTVQEFEAKARLFEKGYLKKYGKKPLNSLEMETVFWKATLDKPFSVEYANDMPGSAFSLRRGDSGNVTVSETEWNMKGVSRAKGSLLRFMKEEIPGVTSPMVYIAMMFSWFAWHVEDHDLHSLNYLHMGAGKTWYGVPRDAAVAFEDVIRVHGYGGEINPLVTFATLGEKTTVMSPEVLVKAGVPCCRLVQNPGEFVVTFPRAYHSGFSHGFNCGEAANIATPEWLMVAKDAAIRRASINCPPMVSHFQLLYDLALSLCSRVPKKIGMEPRSSRLKDKKKDEGEMLVKDQFVQDVLQNNSLLHSLSNGSSVVILERISLSKSSCSKFERGVQSKVKAGLLASLSSPDLELKTRQPLLSQSTMLEIHQDSSHETGSRTRSSCPGSDKDQYDKVSNQGLFSCITCGILCFASVAIIQPTETASQYLLSGDCSIFSNWGGTSGVSATFSQDSARPWSNSSAGLMLKRTTDGLFDVPIKSAGQMPPSDDDNGSSSSNEACSYGNAISVPNEAHRDTSSLGLLALNYGHCSDSEDDEAGIPIKGPVTKSESSLMESAYGCYNIGHSGARNHSDSSDNSTDEIPSETNDSYLLTKAKLKGKDEAYSDHPNHKIGLRHLASFCSLGGHMTETMSNAALVPSKSTDNPFAPRCDEDSSRMHIFCLEHALQVEQQLRSIGGSHVLLLCHPDYPDLETQAKKVAEEIGNDNIWSDISFREASKEEEEVIRLALDSEEAIHGNGDWAVKLGINLFYSANLSRSPLYSKQMPFNQVIYTAFGCKNVNKSQANGKWSGRHKKVVVAGKWCGKVWMSNQVHPLLAEGDSVEQEPESTIPGTLQADLKLQQPLERTKTAEVAFTSCKVGRKRKASSQTRSVMKTERLVIKDPEEDVGVISVTVKPRKNNLTNKAMEEDIPDWQMQSARHAKPLAEDSEEDSEVVPPSRKMNKNNPRDKRLKKEIPEPQMKSVRNRKLVEAEDPKEDFEILPVSGKWQHRKNHVSNAMEEEIPDWWNQNVGNAKQLVAENSEEDSEVRATTRKQRKTNPRDKRMKKETSETQMKRVGNRKRLEAEDPEEDFEVLPVPGNQQHKSNLRNKQMRKETPGRRVQNPRDSKQGDSNSMDDLEGGPSTRLRKRPGKPCKEQVEKVNSGLLNTKLSVKSKTKKGPAVKAAHRSNRKKKTEELEFQCNMDGCSMSFGSKQELILHRKNICPIKGCGKKFFSHKYLVQHRRVHLDDRPLKCPWKGCKMTFKWAWARTEHIRVHTGDRPYVCAEPGCGQTFRFVSDFSRHKRKTGHVAKKVKR